MSSLQAVPLSKFASLLDTRQLSLSDLQSIFQRAAEFSRQSRNGLNFSSDQNLGTKPEAAKIIASLFLEPSTRTRMSFQIAAQRLGHRTVVLDGDRTSSMSKGESDVDTVLNIAAMRPDAIIVRYNLSPGLDELLPTLDIPVISAGSGTLHHPTQALLDAFTIMRERGHHDHRLDGERVLIVGDIAHSRVASSNFDTLLRLGAEVAICGPPDLLPQGGGLQGVDYRSIKVFSDLNVAIEWPTVYMGLRIQLERHDHSSAELRQQLASDFHGKFGLSEARLRKLDASATILHPGPINHGVEFCPEVVRDPRSRILEQVTNGVLIRAAVLERSLHRVAAV